MRLIEIDTGLSVSMDDIVAIKKKTANTSTVYTTNGIFKSNMSYKTLLSLFNGVNKQEESSLGVQLDLNKQFTTV